MAFEAAQRGMLRDELRALIAESTLGVDSDLADDTPLISSGLVESTTLLSVAVWVEARVDPAVDLSSFDLATAWDSVSAILDFVERHAAAWPTGGSRGG